MSLDMSDEAYRASHAKRSPARNDGRELMPGEIASTKRRIHTAEMVRRFVDALTLLTPRELMKAQDAVREEIRRRQLADEDAFQSALQEGENASH
jgi:hypothetical protein